MPALTFSMRCLAVRRCLWSTKMSDHIYVRHPTARDTKTDEAIGANVSASTAASCKVISISLTKSFSEQRCVVSLPIVIFSVLTSWSTAWMDSLRCTKKSSSLCECRKLPMRFGECSFLFTHTYLALCRHWLRKFLPTFTLSQKEGR